MGCGIEGRRIFRNAGDRKDFLSRLGALCEAENVTVYAWALIPNHFHLLARTGNRLLASSMKKLLTGDVVNFNRRRLFQNRCRSIICEDDPIC